MKFTLTYVNDNEKTLMMIYGSNDEKNTWHGLCWLRL